MNNNLINTKIIESYLKENNLSTAKFCKICGISLNSYKQIRASEDCKLDALFKIAKVLKVPIYQIFNN